MTETEVELHQLQSVLREARTDIPGLPDLLANIPFVVVGAVACNAYCNRPRNRGDIASIIIKTPVDLKKVKNHLTVLYPQAPDDFTVFIAKLQQDFEL